MEHKIYIDNLRGFAIFIVVMGHCCEFGIGERHSLFNDLYYSFHMPLFMFISGLVAYQRDNMSFGKFFANKFNRLIIPFLTIGMFLSCWARNLTVFQFWMSDSKCGYWYLYTYFVILMITYPAYKLSIEFNQSKSIWKDIFFYCIPFVLLLFLFPVIRKYQDILTYLSLLKLYPFFILGLLMTKYPSMVLYLRRNICMFFMLLMTVASFFILRKFEYPISLCGYFGVPIIFLMFKDSLFLNKSSLFTKIGGATLQIYVLHYFFIPHLPGVNDYLKNASCFFVPNSNILLYFVVSSVIAIWVILASLLIVRIANSSSWMNYLLFGIKR